MQQTLIPYLHSVFSLSQDLLLLHIVAVFDGEGCQGLGYPELCFLKWHSHSPVIIPKASNPLGIECDMQQNLRSLLIEQSLSPCGTAARFRRPWLKGNVQVLADEILISIDTVPSLAGAAKIGIQNDMQQKSVFYYHSANLGWIFP